MSSLIYHIAESESWALQPRGRLSPPLARDRGFHPLLAGGSGHGNSREVLPVRRRPGPSRDPRREAHPRAPLRERLSAHLRPAQRRRRRRREAHRSVPRESGMTGVAQIPWIGSYRNKFFDSRAGTGVVCPRPKSTRGGGALSRRGLGGIEMDLAHPIEKSPVRRSALGESHGRCRA